MLLPQPKQAFRQIDFEEAAAAKDKCFSQVQLHYDRDKVKLAELVPGQLVRVQSQEDKTWDRLGTIVEMRPDRLSYLVETGGKTLLRGRALLRPALDNDIDSENQGQECDQISGGVLSPSAPAFVPRRSERLLQKSEHKVSLCVDQVKKKIPTVSGVSTTPPTRRRPPIKPLTRQPEGSAWSTFNGPASPQGRRPLSSLPFASSPSSSACGASHAPPGRPASGTLSSSVLCPPLLPVPGLVRSPPALQMLPMGRSTSGPRQVGRPSPMPTAPQVRFPGCPSLSSRLCSMQGSSPMVQGSMVTRLERPLPIRGSTPSPTPDAPLSSTLRGSRRFMRRSWSPPPRLRGKGAAAPPCVVLPPSTTSVSEGETKSAVLRPQRLHRSSPPSRSPGPVFMQKTNTIEKYNKGLNGVSGSVFNMKVRF